MEHNDDCIWRTKNKVNHLGDPDLGECSCKCHKVEADSHDSRFSHYQIV